MTSLGTTIGPEGNALTASPAHARQVVLPFPVIDNDELAKIVHINADGDLPGYATHVVRGLYDVSGGAEAMQARLEQIFGEAGAIVAFDRAIAADPGFALAHAGKAQVLLREGDVAAARAALAAAKGVAAGVSDARGQSHRRSSTSCSPAERDAAIAALDAHLSAWPRDALVVASAANPNGLIGGSGRIGQKHQIAVLMDSLAPHYGDDFWFLSYHAMALSEDGQLAAARPKIERSVAVNPNNAHGAHGFAHVCYESGDPDTGRTYPVVLAHHLPARRLLLWPSELASLAVRTAGRQLG